MEPRDYDLLDQEALEHGSRVASQRPRPIHCPIAQLKSPPEAGSELSAPELSPSELLDLEPSEESSEPAAAATAGSFELTYRIVRPDGAERILHGEGLVLTRADGTPRLLVGTAHDVTELKATEEALARTNRDLVLRNRELQEFAYVASHDL